MEGPVGEVFYEVLPPVGEAAVKAEQPAPRLNTLEGKTICEVYNGLFGGEKTFPRIRESIKKRFPGVKIIPYTELPEVDIVKVDKVLVNLPNVLSQKGCDAIISGNGG